MNEKDSRALLGQVERAVLEAGDLIIEGIERPKSIRHKGAIDLVTETDLAVEELLKKRLAAIVPGSHFLAEETAADAPLENGTWIIDPLDGTTNFAHGIPFVATSVGLWFEERIILGVVNLPLLGELFSAVRGGGTRRNGSHVRVSEERELSSSLVATGFPYGIGEHLETIATNLKTFLAATQGLRRPGAAALDLAYVACGRYEGFYESALNAWDTAAGWLLVEEAGGRVTQYDASESYFPGAPTILASNGLVHEAMSGLLAGKK